MINIALLGKWHVHADDYARQAFELTDKVKIIAVWDDDENQGKKWAEELNAKFCPTYQEILTSKDIDAIVCSTQTTKHREVLCAAAKAGKHIFTEKMLACTAEDAQVIADDVKKAGITFAISHPLTSNAVIRRAKKLIESEKLGKISFVRFRRSHSGISDDWLPARWFDVSASGGGAMMDLGAHPVYILHYLCGEPTGISTAFSNLYGTSSDENAVVVLKYDNGIIGLAEASFVTYGVPDILEVYGTNAFFIAHGDNVTITAKEKDTDGKSLESGKVLASSLQDDEIDDPFTLFIDALINKTSIPEQINIDTALACAKIMAEIYEKHCNS